MSDNENSGGSRGKSEFMKRLTAGKTLCSEVNKASSNAKFLHMRRHNAFVSQLESAKNSMLVENERAQKDMRKQLDVYKRRKRTIFRERVLSQQLNSDDEDAVDPSLRHSLRSATSRSSRGGGCKSSSYSVGGKGAPITSSGSSTGGLFPAILRVPMMVSDDESINSAIQRQLQQHMQRQESLHAQILRNRVHEFCNEIDSGSGHTFYITSTRRRIAFSEGTKSAKGKRMGSSLPATINTALPSVT